MDPPRTPTCAQSALDSRAGRGIVAATVLGSSVAFLDATAVNVALPALGRGLRAGFAGLQWTVDGYLLSLSALVLLGGALGDRFGRRRIYEVGLAWFVVASALCAAAPSIGALIAARVVQGIGAALLVPGSLALLKVAIVERDQPRAIGAWAGMSGVASAVGPLLGGWLVDALSWRAIFLINLPLGAIAFWVTRRHVPAVEALADRHLDLLGAALALLGLGALTWGLVELPQARAASRAFEVAALGVGVAALVGLLAAEARVRDPMLPLRVFRSRGFSGANLTTLAVYFALGGTTFLLVLFLQRVMGYSAVAAGAALTPVTLLMLVLSPVAGRLVGVAGARLLMTVGPLVAAAGLFLLGRLSPQSGYLTGVLPGIGLLGVGLACTVTPLTTAMLASVAARDAGVGSGVNNAVARTAGLLAVALLPAIAGISAGGDASALADGFGAAMRVSAAIAVAGAAVACAMVPGRSAAAGA